jgi:hypothetical protein
MSAGNFFKPYQDSMFAHIWEFLRVLITLMIILWVQTGVASGLSDYDIVSFTFNLGILMLVLKAISLTIYLVSPSKEDKTIFSTIGFGTGWRMFWGIILGAMTIGFLDAGAQMSFFSPFLQFGNTHMFWFLVVLGPTIEEGFSNTFHPMITKVLMLYSSRTGRPISYLAAGSIALFLIVAPAFSLFHYVTYFQKSGADMAILTALLIYAYVYRVIFTLGNYILKTDEFGNTAHILHNLIGYWVMIGNPLDILPKEQVIILFIMFVGLGIYFTSLIIYRIGRYGTLRGLAPETALDDT